MHPGSFLHPAPAPLLGLVQASPTEAVLEATSASAGDVTLLVASVVAALGFSFLCSVAEAVLLSLSPAYIESVREARPRLAVLLKRLRLVEIDRSLAAILTLNTIAHTVGSIVAGAKATVVFGSAWIGLFSAVITLLILFLSEIVPKTIGAVYWKQFVAPVALFVQALIVLLYPLVWVSEGMTKLISRGRVSHVFSREEFVAMAGIGEESGHIDERESRIIRNLLKLGSLRVVDVMTPRVVISACRRDGTVEDALARAADAPFSRLPIYGKDLDDITGFVLKDELLLHKSLGKGDTRLETLERDILAVPESMSLSMLLDLFLDKRRHIAVVVDEYGGTRGLATLEDVLETLLGMEIIDEVDDVEDMRALARQQWQERARALGLELQDAEPEPGGRPGPAGASGDGAAP